MAVVQKEAGQNYSIECEYTDNKEQVIQKRSVRRW
jgi:hypothetical protein